MISRFTPGFIARTDEHIDTSERAVAFLDILGFKKLSDALLSDPSQLAALDYQLFIAERILRGDVGIAKETDVRMFSDSICVSTPVSDDHLVRLVYILEALQFMLARSGIFLRGGLAIGQHFQTERTLVSSGLIAAYELESRVAVYPRIVVHESFINEIARRENLSWVNPWYPGTLIVNDRVEHNMDVHIRADVDGLHYIHYMADMYSIDNGRVARDALWDHKHAILTWIAEARRQGASTRVTAKHSWLVAYHNTSVGEVWYDDQYKIDENELREVDL